MLYNKTLSNELLDSVEGINSKTLSLRIREMKRYGLIKRHVHAEMPLRIEYELMEKAKNLRPILEQMEEYSARYRAADVLKDRKPRSFKQALVLESSVMVT